MIDDIGLALLRQLATDPEACMKGTPMVPIQQSTLAALVAELEDWRTLKAILRRVAPRTPTG